jgi:hypothetical protein
MSDPHPQLQPFKPTSDDPFDAVKAAHLMNRAGFGGTRVEIDKVMKLGPDGAIDWLLDFPNKSAEEQQAGDVPDHSALKDYPDNQRELSMMYVKTTPEERMKAFQMFQAANRSAMLMTSDWWVKRMATAAHPLQEKLTLFWHGHFATSAKDERQAKLMWGQNEQLRKHAAGNRSSNGSRAIRRCWII